MSVVMGVGASSEADIFAAGQEAAREVVAHLGGRAPDLTIVFSSIRFADPRMLKAVRSVAGPAPLIGCTDAGGIMTAGPKRRSVTVIGLMLGEGRCVTSVERQLSVEPFAAGERLATALQQQLHRPAGSMLVFFDGLTASGSEVLAGLKNRLDRRVSVAGASAGDDFYFQKTFQYYNDEVLTDGLVGVQFSREIRLGVGVRHGWLPVGRPRKVTRSLGRVVYQLDHRPAVSIYEDFLGLKRQELLGDPLASITLPYPLGLEPEGNAEYLLRDAIRVGRAGSLLCTGDVPQGSDVRLMIGGYESALEAAQQAACDAKDRLGRVKLCGGLVFSSGARQKMLGSEFQGEIDVIRDALGGSGVRLGGFYSYGEVAPSAMGKGGLAKAGPVFHNESVVVVALG